jgi:amidase
VSVSAEAEPAGAVVARPRQPVGWPAWRLRDAVAHGQLRAAEMVEAHLVRLDSVQPALNAAITVRHEAAMREARDLQDALDAGLPAGALCGVPFTAKDVIATAGTTTTCGSSVFADHIPDTDATAVARLRAAGAILIAKTNCPEFAFGITTDSPVLGTTHNPRGPHSPGGSSGGEAALVAAGASALGLGTDYGGSLRWPAQCCGVLALRPGLGRVDGTGQLPAAGGRMDGRAGDARQTVSVQRYFQVVGPIARTVRDLAIALSVIAGVPYPGAPGAGPEAAGIGDLTVGWTATDASEHVGVATQWVITTAVTALAARGVAVAHTPDLLDGLHNAFNELRATDGLADLKSAVANAARPLSAQTRAILDAAPASTADPAPLWARVAELRAGVLRQLEHTPVVLVPVAPSPACDLQGNAVVDGKPVHGFELMAQCRAVSALGVPALSIPIGQVDGLPVSVQILAAPGREDLALTVGRVLEELLGGYQPPTWLASSPSLISTTPEDPS